MKRFLVVLLACLLACGTASANSWGLSGGLLEVVSSSHDYDDYAALCQLKLNDWHLAVMHSRYHNVLMAAEKQGSGKYGLAVNSTRAVYQPDDGRDSECRLTETADGFCLAYGGESYAFAEGAYQPITLHRAEIGGMTLTAEYRQEDECTGFYGYIAEDGEGTAFWQADEVSLADFNIRLLPRSTGEIRRINAARSSLREDGEIAAAMTECRLKKADGKKNLPVYSAPDESSWRAAEGKAAVSLQGGVDVLTSSEGWHLIRYEISPRTSRIGYVNSSALGEAHKEDVFFHVPMTAVQDTYITDDPEVSQLRQAELPAGTKVDGLCVYGDYYAYVETEIDGKSARGFVPLRDLEPPHDEVLPEVMAQLAGEWAFSSGGNVSDDHMIFCADGTYTGYRYNDELVTDVLSRAPVGDEISATHRGTWVVTSNDLSRCLYMEDDPYVLTIRYEDGRVRTFGLSLSETYMGLTYGPGGGGYARIK